MRVEKVYKPNWADKMVGYLVLILMLVPLVVATLVWSLVSDDARKLSEVIKGETK